jgi:hypothetical protein
MQQDAHYHNAFSIKLACYISLFVGVIAAVFAFISISKNLTEALYVGITAIVIGGVSAVRARRNIDDTQVATAGVILAIVACVVALVQMHS